MDLFGNIPFVTAISRELPPQRSRKEVFEFVEKELIEIENLLPQPKTAQYGRVDRASAWALLSRMYLNAEIYLGGASRSPEVFTNAITYANKVINSGYQLHGNYANMFRADNHLVKDEFIFAVPYDGIRSQGFGGTTYLVKAATFDDVASNMMPNGLNEGWECIRVRANLPLLFPDTGFGNNKDRRALFSRDATTLNMTRVLDSKGGGYRCVKFSNKNSDGTFNATRQFSDTDFPLFRLGEIYLIYAEAVLRGGSGGDLGTALTYINSLRQRAYGTDEGNITGGDLTLDFILDERGRELYWEGHRRTDLVRFGRFTSGSYLWQFKGGSATGRPVAASYNLYPIPSTDLLINTNLKQNPGY
jgi:hypothetical protein